MPLSRKITMCLIVRAIDAAMGNPTDVAMIWMQVDGRLSVAQHRNYKTVVNAIIHMVRQEGVRACGMARIFLLCIHGLELGMQAFYNLKIVYCKICRALL